jgi:hypothetical protein
MKFDEKDREKCVIRNGRRVPCVDVGTGETVE